MVLRINIGRWNINLFIDTISQTKTLVCLGSGGGFIPRIMSKVNDDLEYEGFMMTNQEEGVIMVLLICGCL